MRPSKYLFLDRDGVINIERPDDYVKNVSEFIFIDGALEAIAKLTRHFTHIFIITNQRGIGRGVMSMAELDMIHLHMVSEINKLGGRITNVYFCTDISSTSINRKPNIGMAFLAKSNHPEIQFEQSIMVGNSRSDIEFGNKLGMFTVLVGDKYPKEDKIYEQANAFYENLDTFANKINEQTH